MKSYCLIEYGFIDIDKKMINVEFGFVESSCLVGCGDGLNYSIVGDRFRRKELFG